MSFPKHAVLAAVVLLVAASPFAQDGRVTLEQIMADPDWLGRQPQNPYWADDNLSFYYERKQDGAEARDLFQADLEGTVMRQVEDADRGNADVHGGDWSRDRTSKVYTHEGDLFLEDVANGRLRQLTRTEARESSPRFLVGDDRIWFHRGDEVFVRELDSGLEYQPAVLRLEKDPPRKSRSTTCKSSSTD